MNSESISNAVMLTIYLFGIASIFGGIAIGLGWIYFKLFGHKSKTVYFLKDVPEGESC